MNTQTYFGIVDCNNFYVSCERLFAPNLDNKPIVVLSNNDGCVIARSAEAKALGVPMAVAYFQIRELVKQHDIHVFSSNYALYGDLSNRVMETVGTVCPTVEIYSIDEAFVAFNYLSPEKLAHKASSIRERCVNWVGIPVKVGIAPSKTLAKTAAYLVKKNMNYNGNCIFTSGEEAYPFIKDLSLSTVWGFGKGYVKRLNDIQKVTIGDFLALPSSWVKKNMGVQGLRTWYELKGNSCLPIVEKQRERKMIMTSRSFGRPVNSYREMKEAVSTYSARCTEKLRRQNLESSCVTVYLTPRMTKEGKRVSSHSYFINLSEATSDTGLLLKTAYKCLDILFNHAITYKKAGVILSGLRPVGSTQLSINSQVTPSTHRNKLMQSLDFMNMKHGQNTIRFLSEGIEKDWKMRCGSRSGRCTTSWDELYLI